MALGCRVDTVHPIDLQGLAEVPFTVKNVGTKIVYYKQGALGSSVTPTNKDGEITEGKEFVVTQPTWVIAKEPGAQLDFRVPARTTYAESNIRVIEEGGVNVKAAPFNATGNGVTDDTAAIQAAINAGKEKVVEIPPGKYQITSPLELPVSTVLQGTNWRTCVLEAEGEIDLIRLVGTGDITVKSLFLKAKSVQAAAGSAIDFSHGFSSDAWFDEIRIGSNFFNGIFMVGTAEISDIRFRRLRFLEFNSAVKKFGNAAVVMGKTTTAKRVVTPYFSDVIIQAATEADMPKCFEINNTDSAQLTDVLMQTAEKGLVVGNADASTKRTTNLYAKSVIADGCNIGYELSSLFSGELTSCHAEACGASGLVGLAEVTALNITGGGFYSCQGSGMKFETTADPARAVNITGVQILNNGQNKEAGKAGIQVEKEAGGLTINGCSIGNSPLFGPEEQKVGIFLEKKVKNVVILGNRFNKNVTANVKVETEGSGLIPAEAKIKEFNLES